MLIGLYCCTTDLKQKKPATSDVKIHDNVINDDLMGIGFHVFYHLHNAPVWHYEEIFAKRWRELNPAFARITDKQDLDDEEKDRMAGYLVVMKDTDTELYFTTWNTRDIKLLAIDASPFTYWLTIEWAAENMDDITGVYGGHHYINGYDLFDTGHFLITLKA